MGPLVNSSVLGNPYKLCFTAIAGHVTIPNISYVSLFNENLGRTVHL